MKNAKKKSWELQAYTYTAFVAPLQFDLIISAKEGKFSLLFVCFCVSNFTQKLPNGFARHLKGRLATAELLLNSASHVRHVTPVVKFLTASVLDA